MQPNSFTNISRIVNFFHRSKEGGFLFCTCDDPRLIHEINTQVIKRTASSGIRIQELFLDAGNVHDFITAIKQISETGAKGIIVSNLDTQMNQTNEQIIRDINFSREVMIELKICFLFWLSEKNLPRFSNKATDLFLRRDRSVIRFDKNIITTEYESFIPTEYIADEVFSNLQGHQVKIELLEKQLSQAAEKGYAKKRIAREVVYDLLQAYLKSKDIKKASLLFQQYKKYFEKSERLDDRKLCASIYFFINDFDSAGMWYQKLLEGFENTNDKSNIAVTYHQLGRIAQEKRDFNSAEKWYRKSLDIKKKLKNEHGEAMTYHQLGRIAEEKWDFNSAEAWYQKSLYIERKLGNDYGIAMTNHQLGIIAHKKRDFNSAERWYQKSLEIKQKLGDECGVSSTYHQLGRLAEEKRDFNSAEKWYRKSLDIKGKFGNELGAASTYHQMGILDDKKRDFNSAEKWYRKSLDIKEKFGDEFGAAITYHQMGRLADKKKDFNSAETWYQKSLDIKEKFGNELSAARTYYLMGRLAKKKQAYNDAKKWLQKALHIFEKYQDDHRTIRTRNLLNRVEQKLQYQDTTNE